MSETKLKPCSECGCVPKVRGDGKGHFRRDGSKELFWEESEVIAAWNTRTDPQRQRLVDALKAAERILTELYPSEPCAVEHETEYYAVNGVLNQARAVLKEVAE